MFFLLQQASGGANSDGRRQANKQLASKAACDQANTESEAFNHELCGAGGESEGFQTHRPYK